MKPITTTTREAIVKALRDKYNRKFTHSKKEMKKGVKLQLNLNITSHSMKTKTQTIISSYLRSKYKTWLRVI